MQKKKERKETQVRTRGREIAENTKPLPTSIFPFPQHRPSTFSFFLRYHQPHSVDNITLTSPHHQSQLFFLSQCSCTDHLSQSRRPLFSLSFLIVQPLPVNSNTSSPATSSSHTTTFSLSLSLSVDNSLSLKPI